MKNIDNDFLLLGDAGYVWYELVVGSAKMLFLMWCRIMRWLVLGSAKEGMDQLTNLIVIIIMMKFDRDK